MLKQCKQCGGEFPATLEYFRVSRHGNVSSPCKSCIAAKKQEWRENNPQLVKDEKARSHVKCREKNNARAKAWYEANRETVLERIRKENAENPQPNRDRVAKWYEANRGAVLEKAFAKYYLDVDASRAKRRNYKPKKTLRYATVRKASKANRRAREMNAEGSHTAAEIRELFHDQHGRCGYCGINLMVSDTKAEYHVDHIVPLSRGGSNYIDNILVSCADCNLSKGDKLLQDWEMLRGW
jgi:5-methylcytosine-specific restriction endonuclease McrA